MRLLWKSKKVAKEMIQSLNNFLSKFNLHLMRKSTYDRTLGWTNDHHDYAFASVLDAADLPEYFKNLDASQSQLRQDLFALSEHNWKSNGYFVEFGATNGVKMSNTHLLERKFNWTGILAEPARVWQSELMQNRDSHICFECVWKSTGETVVFNEVIDDVHNGELSTIDEFSNSDGHKKARKNRTQYDVETISLTDLLHKFNAPRIIDYLSIDTEGSEFEILQAFDFSAFDIKVITCEHNYTEMREKIYDLLVANGYVRKYEKISRFDDWYVKV